MTNMQMVGFFHMNGGLGDASYSSNSSLQRMGITMTKDIIEEAISGLRSNNINFPESLKMADLGCSSGPNTFLVASMLINGVAKISLQIGQKPPEIQMNLNDLPTNDYNTIFNSLQEFQDLTKQNTVDVYPTPSCYFTGVPGSFYGRIFPVKTLHFVHSSYSLHWLSQVPKLGLTNKGSIHLSNTTPESVTLAYYEQFQKDFMAFLRCRSEEMISGGYMVLTLYGRRNEDPCCEENYYLWRLFAMALEHMVYEGLVHEEKLDSFNLPFYTVSPTEIKNLVEKEGSFTLNRLEVFDVNWSAWNTKKYDKDASHHREMEGHGVGRDVAKAVRAGIESLVVNHFGEAIVEDVFMKYEENLTHRTPMKEKEAVVTITISLKKM